MTKAKDGGSSQKPERKEIRESSLGQKKSPDAISFDRPIPPAKPKD